VYVDIVNSQLKSIASIFFEMATRRVKVIFLISD
jgi:hypothetical protein